MVAAESLEWFKARAKERQGERNDLKINIRENLPESLILESVRENLPEPISLNAPNLITFKYCPRCGKDTGSKHTEVCQFCFYENIDYKNQDDEETLDLVMVKAQ